MTKHRAARWKVLPIKTRLETRLRHYKRITNIGEGGPGTLTHETCWIAIKSWTIQRIRKGSNLEGHRRINAFERAGYNCRISDPIYVTRLLETLKDILLFFVTCVVDKSHVEFLLNFDCFNCDACEARYCARQRVKYYQKNSSVDRWKGKKKEQQIISCLQKKNRQPAVKIREAINVRREDGNVFPKGQG